MIRRLLRQQDQCKRRQRTNEGGDEKPHETGAIAALREGRVDQGEGAPTDGITARPRGQCDNVGDQEAHEANDRPFAALNGASAQVTVRLA